MIPPAPIDKPTILAAMSSTPGQASGKNRGMTMAAATVLASKMGGQGMFEGRSVMFPLSVVPIS